MKKLLFLIGVSALTLSLVGCVTTEDNKDKNQVTTTQSNESVVVEQKKEQKENKGVVIYNSELVTVTLFNSSYDKAFDTTTLEYSITNHSERQLIISARGVSVDNKMDDLISIYAELPSGKTTTTVGYFEAHNEAKAGDVLEGVIYVSDTEYNEIESAEFTSVLTE